MIRAMTSHPPLRAGFILAMLLPLGAAPPNPPAKGNRCGWIHNPTPANWWLVDRDGEWEIGSQGGYQAPGIDNIPDLSERQWVKTNGYYGYGCGCMTVSVDPKSRRITRIYSVRQQSLAVCRGDRKLPKPG